MHELDEGHPEAMQASAERAWANAAPKRMTENDRWRERVAGKSEKIRALDRRAEREAMLRRIRGSGEAEDALLAASAANDTTWDLTQLSDQTAQEERAELPGDGVPAHREYRSGDALRGCTPEEFEFVFMNKSATGKVSRQEWLQHCGGLDEFDAYDITGRNFVSMEDWLIGRSNPELMANYAARAKNSGYSNLLLYK